MISKTKMKSLLFIFLFIYILYLKFISLLFFFFYILSINVYVLDHRCKKIQTQRWYPIHTCIYTRSTLHKFQTVSYIHILIDDRDSMALYDDRSMTSAEWTSSTKATRTLEKIKWKSQFWVKLGRSNLKHGLPKGFFSLSLWKWNINLNEEIFMAKWH